MGIKHKASKVSGDKGLASEWNDDHKIDGNVDFEKHEAQRLAIHTGSSFPASPVTGQVFYHTSYKKLYYFDGSNWVTNAWEKITDFTVGPGAHTDQIAIALDGDADVEIMIIVFVNNDTLVGGTLLMLPNGLTTNLTGVYTETNGAVTNIGSLTTGFVGELPSNSTAHVTILVHTKSGTERAGTSKFASKTGGIRVIGEASWFWTDTATNITQLVIASSSSQMLGPGTHVLAYKKAG